MAARSRRAAVTGALTLLLGSALPARAAEQNPAVARDNASSAQAGGATIRGRVVASDSGLPLRGAVVALAITGRPWPQTASTDENGLYEIGELPAGRFELTASRPGYVRLSFGQTRPNQGGRQIVLADKQILSNINFALPRGGVIAGVVVDEWGQPVIGAAVAALRRIYKDGRSSLLPVPVSTSGATSPLTGLILSNDLGEFRVYGLEPGSFYVGTMTYGQSAGGGPPRPGPMVYAPGTANVAEAQRIAVGLGQTVSGVTVVMRTGTAVTVSGVALDVAGQPMTGAVTLRQRSVDASLAPATRVQSRADGSFSFSQVLPGDYDIAAQFVRNGIPAASIGRVSVGSADVREVRLIPMTPVVATGRVIVEPPGTVAPGSIRIATRPAGDELFDSTLLSMSDTLSPEFAFTLRPFPVRAHVLATLPAGWGVRTVRVRGVDVTDSGIEFRPGEDIRDIEIEISTRRTELSGTVRGPNNQVIEDCTVIVFARDLERRTTNARRFSVVRPDQNGVFSVSGLAAGDYLAVALDYVDMDTAQDPQLLEGFSRLATRFSLLDGETKLLSLTIATP